jgi:hypothetical protein
MTKIGVIFHSSTGTTAQLAVAVTQGVNIVDGATGLLMCVHDSDIPPLSGMLSPATRKQVVLAAAASKDTIAGLSIDNGVNRKTVRNVCDKAIQAVDDVLEPSDSDVLYSLPITKKWIESLVLGLILTTRAFHRAIISPSGTMNYT